MGIAVDGVAECSLLRSDVEDTLDFRQGVATPYFERGQDQGSVKILLDFDQVLTR